MKIRPASFNSLRSSIAALAVALLSAAPALAADARTLEKPAATQMDLLPAELVDSRFAPELDYGRIASEDEVAAIAGEAPRYAIPNQVHLNPSMDGIWETVQDKDGSVRRVWRLRLICENAVSMNLGFTEFWLPKTATLFVHDGEMASIVRPFTAADNADHGQLWTPPVPGNEIVVELTVDKEYEKDVRLVVGSVNAGYRRFMEIAKEALGTDKSGSCNVDVVCSQGDGWRNEIPSVGVISTGGSRFCTGAMINNVRQDLTPYFLTAFHCSVTASNAASLVVFWNYENSTCRTPGSTASGSAGNGQLTQFNTGSTFRAGYSASDMTLVQLTSLPNPAWKVSYAGFDARNVETTSNIAIHHPNTDEKRISFDNQASTTTSYNSSTSPGDGTHIRVGNWELGTTEPGSSGSPLFNQNHQIVGQLHGGSASCTSITNDFYGRLSVSWNGGGTAATSLKTWLDPDNTGTQVVNTRTTGGLSVSPSAAVTALGNVGGPFSGLPVTHVLTNGASNSVNYTVSMSSSIGLLLNGGTSSLSGSLPAGGTANVVVSAGSALLSASAGIYSANVVFTDTTNNIVTTVPYTVEVGQTGISVTPATGLTGGGALGGPFTATQQYVITSTKTAPVSVTVSANVGWVTIDGSSVAQSFTLNTQGASRTVTVAFGGSATSLSAGVYTGLVSISNASGGSGSTSRSATLEVGRQVYAATDCPKTVNDNTTVYSYINVADDVCIGDLDVSVDITHTYIGDLIVELMSPAGTIVSLHNRTGSGADNIVTTYNDETGGTVPASSLTAFDGERTAGQWRLRVSDAANTDTGTLNGWQLRIAQSAGGCQPRQVVHSEPLDSNPGWTTTGQWGFGVPTGGGASNGAKDPTSGATGSNVYGYNLAGDYTNSMPAYTLTSTAFDCTGLTGTKVAFKRWLNVESSSYDKASFSVSNNGTTWTTVWQNGATLKETAWSSVSYDISAVADNQPTVYLRWTIGPTDTSIVYGGWNIDDIEISAIPAANPCPSDLDGDGEITMGDAAFMLLSAGPCPGCPEDLDGDGEVSSSDVALLLLDFGPCP
jgi:subtilisin-like proprotein convertase family protein